MLTAAFPIAKTQRGIVWLCRCDCGGLAQRTAAALRCALRRGSEACCEQCRQELWSGLLEARRLAAQERRKARVRWYLELWEDSRTLWTAEAETALANDVMSDLVEAFGAVPPDERDLMAAARMSRPYSELTESEPGRRVIPPRYDENFSYMRAWLEARRFEDDKDRAKEPPKATTRELLRSIWDGPDVG